MKPCDAMVSGGMACASMPSVAGWAGRTNLIAIADPEPGTSDWTIRIDLRAKDDPPGKSVADVATDAVHRDRHGHLPSDSPTGSVNFALTYPHTPHDACGNFGLPHLGHGLSVTGVRAW